MITSVQISMLRGVREGGVDGLSPVSILVGPNNAGKSTCLEAIAIVGMGHRADEIAGLVLRRGGPPLDALEQLVTRGAKVASIDLHSKVDGKEVQWPRRIVPNAHRQLPEDVQLARSQGLEEPFKLFTVTGRSGDSSSVYVDSKGRRSSLFGSWGNPLEPFPVRLVDVEAVRTDGALEEAYSRLEDAGQVSAVVKALQRSMPGLTDLRILKVGPDFILHGIRDKERPVPIYVAGDGLKRFLTLAAAMMDSKGGVVLLEEPESFQHPRYLKELATLLVLAAKSGTQVILSTHSIELIDLLLHAPEVEGLTYPTVHRLRLTDGKLRAVTIDREHALAARDDLLEDLRS